jgi:hypothetical protein
MVIVSELNLYLENKGNDTQPAELGWDRASKGPPESQAGLGWKCLVATIEVF